MQTPFYWIKANCLSHTLPDSEDALTEPNGLLASGGNLLTSTLLKAYQQGAFPWYENDQPILWWSPNPRMVLYPDEIKVSRSLRKNLKNSGFTVSFDQSFHEVIQQCAEPRKYASGTWLTQEMINAYSILHTQKHAHSIECWYADKLVGGLYGIAIGQVFFGESMFSLMNNASKVCMVHLAQMLRSWNYQLIDCQVYSNHLTTLGAYTLPRNEFIRLLQHYCHKLPSETAWQTS